MNIRKKIKLWSIYPQYKHDKYNTIVGSNAQCWRESIFFFSVPNITQER